MYTKDSILKHFSASIDMYRELDVASFQAIWKKHAENVAGLSFAPTGSGGVRFEISLEGEPLAMHPGDRRRLELSAEETARKGAFFKELFPLVSNSTHYKRPIIVRCPIQYAAIICETLNFFHASSPEILPEIESSGTCFVCSEGYLAD